jgi:PBSX family phage terminase large subunit
MIKLSDKIAPIFHPVHRAIRDKTADEFWIKGGRNSTKSSFVALQIVLGIMQDPDANAVCFRKVGAFIKDSIQATILWAIDELGETENFASINSPHEITYLPTGQKILLRGLDKPTKIKSIKLRRGYFKYLWFEEADEYSGDDEIRSVEQSVLRGDKTKKFVEFLTYNPPKNSKHWINKLAEENVDEKFIHHSTYLDIPQDWLSEKTLQKINRLKENNYEAYVHEYLGKCVGNPKEIIFSGKFEEAEFETPPLNELYQSRFFFGADWGFAADPSVLIRMFIKDDCLWIDYEAYAAQVEIDHIGQVIFDKIPKSRKWQIKADNSRPETISNLRRQGFNISGAKKWGGSVEEGVEYIKSFRKIIIHKRCPRILREFETYNYKIDKNTREVLPVIDDTKSRIYEKGDKIGIKDDGIDACRYGLADYIRGATDIIAF